MKRLVLGKLKQWKQGSDRKPLIVRGARQVGKTYVIQEFGNKEYQHLHYFNFEKRPELSQLFEKDYSVERIIKELSYSIGQTIHASNALLFFDEIQACPRAITALKYFLEDQPDFHIISAGSLLGVQLSQESYPVGKVQYLDLFPLNFEEFLMALEEDQLLEVFRTAFEKKEIPVLAHERLWNRLLDYYYVGGMPEVVSQFIRNGSQQTIRELQQTLLKNYHSDVAKHSGKVNSMHIIALLENIPRQLSAYLDGTTGRYLFKNVIPGKKGYASLEGPITWLEKAGLILNTHLCNRAEIPLKAFTKSNMFKLYFFDIGLLAASLELPASIVYEQQGGITKGYLAENLVAQEFRAAGEESLYAWSEQNSEIEFLRVLDSHIVPFEVKASHRTQTKSLKQYVLKYHPERSIVLSAKNLHVGQNRWDVPLYLAGLIR